MKTSISSFKRLKKSGLPEDQAQAIVETTEESIMLNLANFATKTDLNTLEAKLTHDLKALELRTDTKFEQLRGEMNTGFSKLETSIGWLQRLFMGTIAALMVNGAINYFHH